MTKVKSAGSKERTGLWVHLFFILFGLICIVPFMIVISASFSGETDLAINGFSVWPRKWDLTAYAYLFKNPKTIINAYIVTAFITVTGTFLSGSILPVQKQFPVYQAADILHIFSHIVQRGAGTQLYHQYPVPAFDRQPGGSGIADADQYISYYYAEDLF